MTFSASMLGQREQVFQDKANPTPHTKCFKAIHSSPTEEQIHSKSEDPNHGETAVQGATSENICASSNKDSNSYSMPLQVWVVMITLWQLRQMSPLTSAGRMREQDFEICEKMFAWISTSKKFLKIMQHSFKIAGNPILVGFKLYSATEIEIFLSLSTCISLVEKTSKKADVTFNIDCKIPIRLSHYKPRFWKVNIIIKFWSCLSPISSSPSDWGTDLKYCPWICGCNFVFVALMLNN